MTDTERPQLTVIPGGGGVPLPTRIRLADDHVPISITLSGEREVRLFRAAVENQRANPGVRGKSGMDVVFAALSVVFDAVTAGAPEDQPPLVVTDSFEYLGKWEATINVFTHADPPSPPSPPPRCG